MTSHDTTSPKCVADLKQYARLSLPMRRPTSGPSIQVAGLVLLRYRRIYERSHYHRLLPAAPRTLLPRHRPPSPQEVFEPQGPLVNPNYCGCHAVVDNKHEVVDLPEDRHVILEHGWVVGHVPMPHYVAHVESVDWRQPIPRRNRPERPSLTSLPMADFPVFPPSQLSHYPFRGPLRLLTDGATVVGRDSRPLENDAIARRAVQMG